MSRHCNLRPPVSLQSWGDTADLGCPTFAYQATRKSPKFRGEPIGCDHALGTPHMFQGHQYRKLEQLDTAFSGRQARTEYGVGHAVGLQVLRMNWYLQ